jgi:hypothetical protein
VWASASKVEVFINGKLQDSASAVIPAPESMTREMLNIVFADQPKFRLGGVNTGAKERQPFWKRIKSCLHLKAGSGMQDS